jgi:glycosyltransferase involved in cell wall biosynthesis
MIAEESNAKKADISACMIVKNEQEYLEKCLKSIEELVGEIIIIDTGSSDKTKDIAKRFTDKIFDFKWTGDFSEARNFSIKKAIKKWVFVLDADEVVAKRDFGKIKEITENPEADAYYLILRDYSNETGRIDWKSSMNDDYEESKIAAGFTEAPVLRLFKNKKDYLFEGKIHETVQNSIKKAKGRVFMTDIVIHHFGSLREKTKILEKKDVYSELLK